MKTLKILSAVFAVAAVIGFVSFVAGTRSVNLGAFLFPAALAAACAIPCVLDARGKR